MGEVQFFTQLGQTAEDSTTLFNNIAVMKLYSEPDPQLVRQFSQVLATLTLLNSIKISDTKTIKSVVAMIPHKIVLTSGVKEEQFFMLEKPGLDILDLVAPYNPEHDDTDDIDAE